ncbi:MAG TPA: type II toxin-antitoxin system VapC family toxin [Desulfuromonadales bacterium]|nr:type II toxin-antitoxin system VapC family toxin [Desulfuromonadales bacterium]
MGYLIDTNVLSELRKGSKMDKNVRVWFDKVPADDIYLSTLVVGEVRHGIELLRRRDPKAAIRLDTWLAEVQKDTGDRILPVTNIISEQWGRFGVPDPVSVIDGLMAATAMVHGHILVTRNVRDIEQTGVNFINPFYHK